MFDKICLPETRSCDYISLKDEILRPKSKIFSGNPLASNKL